MIFLKMVELQHKFNEETIPGYLEKNLNWNSAIIAKSGELLDSLGYKWWKKQEPDMDNVKVEAIDLLHFVISESLQSFYDSPSSRDAFIERTINELLFSFTDEQSFKGYYNNSDIEKIVGDFVRDRPGEQRLYKLKLIFRKLEMSNEDVYIAYIVKNCLNKFRQDNGYKDGTYIKDWNGEEDNVVAYEIVKKLSVYENMFDKLYEQLTVYYNEEVILKEASKECKHTNGSPSYEYWVCSDCGSIKTDSNNSWGIAKNKWFKNESEAKFYKNNGFLPK